MTLGIEWTRTGKSHSWSSGLSEAATAQEHEAAKVERSSVATSVVDWTLDWLQRWRTQPTPRPLQHLIDFCTAQDCDWEHMWTVVRCSAIGCLVLASLLSLLATFLPSFYYYSSSAGANHTVANPN